MTHPAMPSGVKSGYKIAFHPSGVLILLIGLVGMSLPFLTLSPNRIALGEGLSWLDLLHNMTGWAGLVAFVLGLALGLFRGRPWLHLGGGVAALLGVIFMLAVTSQNVMAEAGDLARVSPASGFWLMFFAASLLIADALTQLRLSLAGRAAVVVLFCLGLALTLMSGMLADLSVMKEYTTRQASFWTALRRHIELAIGSLAAAIAIGLPLGIIAHRNLRLRQAILPVLSLLQTIPSLAMFGIMIPLLAWIAMVLPGASRIGISGIGFAPAFVALVFYSLLPVVGNTVAGLGALPPSVIEAARGMGMTSAQRLRNIELPLALPAILTAIRIVLVQNIGLAVIAGLIGGGGFGTFVFQGLNQAAADLILLGAIPTVIMAMVAAALMDLILGATRRTPQEATE